MLQLHLIASLQVACMQVLNPLVQSFQLRWLSCKHETAFGPFVQGNASLLAAHHARLDTFFYACSSCMGAGRGVNVGSAY
jgi:hypothetical protein